MQRRTFIFADVLKGKCQVGVFALDDTHLSEGASADDTQEAEMIEVYCSSGSQRDSIRRLAIIIHPAVSAFRCCWDSQSSRQLAGGARAGRTPHHARHTWETGWLAWSWSGETRRGVGLRIGMEMEMKTSIHVPSPLRSTGFPWPLPIVDVSMRRTT